MATRLRPRMTILAIDRKLASVQVVRKCYRLFWLVVPLIVRQAIGTRTAEQRQRSDRDPNGQRVGIRR